MNIPENGKQKYVEASSHVALAKEWGLSLVLLESHANEQGWDREHKLYWQDRAISILKQTASEDNLTAVKELLKAMGISRPVGRPSKSEVERYKAIEARLDDELQQDIDRMRAVSPLKAV